MWTMSANDTLLGRARARYMLLVEQLREEEHDDAPRGGWQEQVAQRLGVSQGLVSKYVAGDRQPSLASIDLACERLGIQPEFFFSPDLQTPNYREHQGRDGERHERRVPHWDEFAREYDRFNELGPADIATMRSFDFRGRGGLRIRSWTDWVTLADWVLNRKPSARARDDEDEFHK